MFSFTDYTTLSFNDNIMSLLLIKKRQIEDERQMGSIYEQCLIDYCKES